jgi:DNA-binding transcriptional MerR regulator
MTADGIQNRFSRAEIAEALEISGNQILQYQERSLLASRTANAQDVAYNSLDIARLRFILRCEAAGYQGNDIADFVGTINKGASIKDQLKASLVHAHQKFSYVNAQKRKADVLEQVSLQADADLIQNYIDEMKEILANPQISPIAITRPKRQSTSKIKPEKTTGLEPRQDQRTRLKAALKRQPRPSTEPKPPILVRPSPARTRPKATSPKTRNKFIDSSTTSDEYDQRISDTPQDMFIDYSRSGKSHSKPIKYKGSRKSGSKSWQQTLVTFLLLSLISLAGYAYYIYQSQKSTTTDQSTSLEELTIVNDNLDREKVGDISTEKKEQQTVPSSSSEESVATEDSDLTSGTQKNIKEKVADKKPTSTTAPVTTADPNNDPTPTDSKRPKSTMTSSKANSSDSSLPSTAMKDLDDLLAKKQGTLQQSTEAYVDSERPQVAVYDFKLFYQRSRKILVAKFKIARIRPQRNLVQGRLFVVFKPRQSAQDTKYFSIPDTKIPDGIPTEPFKGIEFSFSESTKVQSIRSIYIRDPSQFEVATIFVFSNVGELVLKKDFTVSVTEY